MTRKRPVNTIDTSNDNDTRTRDNGAARIARIVRDTSLLAIGDSGTKGGQGLAFAVCAAVSEGRTLNASSADFGHLSLSCAVVAGEQAQRILSSNDTGDYPLNDLAALLHAVETAREALSLYVNAALSEHTKRANG